MIVLPIYINPYVKKEDAKEFVERQIKTAPIVLLAVLVVIGMIQFFISPKLLNLYKTANEPVPAIMLASPYIFGGIAVVFILISTYQP